MKKNILILAIFFLLTECLFAQRESANWYFGHFHGITFNTPDNEPKLIYDGKTGYFKPQQTYRLSNVVTCLASISDSIGNLMFYTDGHDIYNKLHEYIKNYTFYNMNIEEAGSAIIIKSPWSDSLYYLFTSGCKNYSVIDMSQDAGLGAIVADTVIEGLVMDWQKTTAIRHRNGKDIWIVTRSYGFNVNTFYSFLWTKNGVSHTPVVSNVGPVGINLGPESGQLKISPDGRKIIDCGASNGNENLLCDFNDSTGKLENPLNLGTTYGYAEFSSDGTKLYLPDDNGIAQFKLDLENPQTIVKSKHYIHSIDTAIAGTYFDNLGIQIGLNGKIYCIQSLAYQSGLQKPTEAYLSVINFPNKPGENCELIQRKYYLGLDSAYDTDLPHFLPNDFYLPVHAYGNEWLCQGDTLYLHSQAQDTGVTYYWTGPNSYTSTEQNPVIPNMDTSMSGLYRVEISRGSFGGWDTVNVVVNPLPDFLITGDTTFCEGDSTQLRAFPNTPEYRYYWSTGDSTAKTVIKKGGIYYLTAVNQFGCSRTDSVHITEFPLPHSKIIPLGPTEFCDGDSVVLQAVPSDTGYRYFWSTYQNTKKITVKTSGMYFVFVTNPNGCRDSASIYVKVQPSLTAKIKINGKQKFCQGGTSTLQAEPSDPAYKYQWNTGDTTENITVNSSGTYKVIISLNDKCFGDDSVNITVFPTPQPTITGDTLICPNSSGKLYLAQDYASYLWNTGDTKKEININKPGIYTVTVTDSNGCTGNAAINVNEYKIDITGLQDLDFGQQIINSKTTKKLTITNNSNSQINIADLKLRDSFDISFSIENPGSKTLDTNESYDIIIDFQPQATGNQSDSIIIEIDNPCNARFAFFVSGSGYNLQSIVSLPDTTALIGDNNFILPLYAKIENIDTTITNMPFTADLQWDARYFSPDSVENTKFILNNILNGQREIKFAGIAPVLNQNENIIAKIHGKILLSPMERTPLKIADFSLSDTNILITKINGSLLVNGICVQSISGLQSFSPVQFTLSPNPAGTQINIVGTLQKNSSYSISIYDNLGIKNLTQSGASSSGTVNNAINIEGMSSGLHIVVITTDYGVWKGMFVKE